MDVVVLTFMMISTVNLVPVLSNLVHADMQVIRLHVVSGRQPRLARQGILLIYRKASSSCSLRRTLRRCNASSANSFHLDRIAFSMRVSLIRGPGSMVNVDMG